MISTILSGLIEFGAIIARWLLNRPKPNPTAEIAHAELEAAVNADRSDDAVERSLHDGTF